MLQIDFNNTVAWVTLDRPEVHNALNPDLVSRLTSELDALGRRSDIRVVVLAGNGKSFCAGADLESMRRALNLTQAENLADARAMAAMFRALAQCPLPVIARVHGAALGGGAGLVAAADIAIALESAVFGFTEVRLGIVPGVISPFVVRRIGAGRAREYCLTGERFSAATAQSIGLIHAVAPDREALDAAVNDRIEQLLLGGPGAIAETKALIARAGSETVDAAADHGASALARMRAGEEGRAGIQAFLDRKPPPWVRR